LQQKRHQAFDCLMSEGSFLFTFGVLSAACFPHQPAMEPQNLLFGSWKGYGLAGLWFRWVMISLGYDFAGL
jgi:hypothetical protein